VTAAKNQYRTSVEQKSQGSKIEEDYSMFDEQQADDDELEDIME